MRIKLLIPAFAMSLLLVSCTNNTDKKPAGDNARQSSSQLSGGWESRYERIDAAELSDNVIDLIGKQWMLVTAGNKDSFNTMTASWGALGYIWEKPASFIFIRDTRYTYEFLQKNEGFTLSFFAENYREALRICGTTSGRDRNKIEESGLTPVATPSGLMSFGEARMIVECKKMFVQKLDYTNLTAPYKDQIMDMAYDHEPSAHQLFVAEITAVWVKK